MVLSLLPQVFPSTLTERRETRAVLAGADTAATSGDGGVGKGKGTGKGEGDGYGKA